MFYYDDALRQDCQRFWKELRPVLALWPDSEFKYSSTFIMKDVMTDEHCDSNNLGPALCLSLGYFEGGHMIKPLTVCAG